MTVHFVVWLFIIVVANITTATCWPATEKSLAKFLLKSYEENGGRIGRPVLNTSAPVVVNMSLSLNQITNEPDNSLTFSANLALKWRDDFLKWNPTAFGNIASIVLPVSSIWKPDVFIADDFYNDIARQFANMEAIDAWLSSDGNVVWVPWLNFRTPCDNATDFQSHKDCTLIFASLTRTSDEIELNYDENAYSDFANVLLQNPGISIERYSVWKAITPFEFARPGGHFSTVFYNLSVKLETTDAGDNKNKSATGGGSKGRR